MKPAALLVAAFAAAVLAGCNVEKKESRVAPPRPVLVSQIHYQPRRQSAALPGVLKARVESDLAFRVAGKVKQRLVDAGAAVRKGDALARLDETDLKLQLDAAEADLASLAAARASAEAEERRAQTLRKQGWAAEADFDKITAVAEQARRAVERAERSLALARNALSYATLEADADGIVSFVAVEPGQVVAAGASVFRLAHAGAVEAAVAAPEALLERVRADPARVEFWALPGVSTEAKLRELSPSADAATRTYPARFALADPPSAARLGMSVTVTLSAEGEAVARAPIGAIFEADHGPAVWVVDRAAGTLRAAAVTIEGYEADSALIAGGVAEGAEIVTLGVHKLDAGQKVRVVTNLAGL